MAQFGTSGKNPPWVRTAAGALGQPTQLAPPLLVQAAIGSAGVAAGHAQNSLQQQQAQQQATSQTVAYNAAGLTALGFSQMGMDQQRENVFLVQNAALQPGTVLSQSGVAIPTSIASVGTPGLALPASLATAPVATVSYPAPRVLQHSSQFQQAQPLSQPPPQHTSKQRVFTGTVNKLHDNFGFVDDEVFFQITCVKGTMPKVGDRVLVEASYNPNMPFKWNATRIQVLPNQSQMQSQSTTSQGLIRPGLLATNSSVSALGTNAVAGMAPQITLTLSSQPGTAIPPTLAIQQLGQAAQTYNQVPPPVSIHNLGHGSPSLVTRMQGLISTRQRHSPPPLRQREREREIRRDERRERERQREREIERERPPPPRKRSRSPRPRSRSPPRRRVRVNPRYVVQIPKVSLDVKEANVMELRKRYNNLYVPSDFFLSSFLWMDAFLLSHPFTWDRSYSFHIMSKEVENIQENNAILEPPDADYAYTAKVMLLSVPPMEEVYHKSCALAEDLGDIKETFVHPTRLISFLVGLKNKNEIMAIGGPWSPSLDGANPDKDPTVLIRTAIRTCKALTNIDLGACTKWYRFAEINYFRGETVHKSRAVPARVETVVIFLPDVWSCTPTRKEWQTMTASYKKQLMKKLHEDSPEASENQETEEGVDSAKKEVSHLSEIDPKSMKIAELRHELESRNLNCKGLKSQLVARLSKALKAEQNKEEEAEEHPEEEDVEEMEKIEEKESSKKKKDDEDKKKDEKERSLWERRYALPEAPSIIVHPSVTAKGGKFDCTTMSLSVLLDYRQEDNKEYSFEVSLFAELFNEMLTRDYGFRIYCALAEVPEKKEIEGKDKDKKKSKEKLDDKDDVDDSDNRKDGSKKDEKKKDDDERELDEDNDEGDEEEEDEEMEEEDDSDKKDKKKDRKKEKDRKQEQVKTYTFDPNLLLAFVYFDQNHCGYLLDKDLEEMIHMLGLNLSRAQVRKLVQNVTVKERLYYRKMTDKKTSVEEQEKNKSIAEKGGQLSEPCSRIEELAGGNNKLLTTGRNLLYLSDKILVSNDPPDVSETGLVMYNGALLKIAKLFEQLERSEKARTHAENRLTCLQDELNAAKESAASSLQSKQKLACHLNECESKLKKSQGEMRLATDKSQKLENIIINCHNLMKSVLTTDNERVIKVDKSVSIVEGGSMETHRRGMSSELNVKAEGHENGEINSQ